MGLLNIRGKKKKRRSKKVVQKVIKPKLEEIKKPLVKRKKKKDDEITLAALRAVVKELDKDIPPKKMRFLLAYIKNGFIGYRAYQSIYPNVSKNSAVVMASNWLKGIPIADLLKLTGFGYEQIVLDLKKLTPERRLFFLMKFFKLDHIAVDVGKLEVTVLPPPKFIPPPSLEQIEDKNIKEIKVRKKIVKKKKGESNAKKKN